jgi:hypothetical protein
MCKNVEPDVPQMIVWCMRFACWIKGCRHALMICNFYWFSTTTMVTRTRVSDTLYVYRVSFHFSAVYLLYELTEILFSSTKPQFPLTIKLRNVITPWFTHFFSTVLSYFVLGNLLKQLNFWIAWGQIGKCITWLLIISYWNGTMMTLYVSFVYNEVRIVTIPLLYIFFK